MEVKVSKSAKQKILKSVHNIKFPKLKGSDKQIYWAEILRDGVYDNFEKYLGYFLVKYFSPYVTDKSYDLSSVYNSDIKELKLKIDPNKLVKLIYDEVDDDYLVKFFVDIFKNDSSKFWIDNFKDTLITNEFVFKKLLVEKIFKENKHKLTSAKSWKEKVDFIPQLEGTPKQISWGESIRDELLDGIAKIDNIDDVIDYFYDVIYEDNTINRNCAEQIKKYFVQDTKYRNEDYIRNTIKVVIKNPFKYITKAKTYIENRDKPIEFFIGYGVVKILIDKCVENGNKFIVENTFKEMFFNIH